MKKTVLCLLALCLLTIPALSMADSTLRVTGAATATAKPDKAEFSVGYSIEDENAGVAQQKASETIEAIIAAVIGEGVAETDIQTDFLNMYPVYNYNESASELKGYRVEHMLRLTVVDLETLSDVIDAALQAGANQANSIRFGSSEADALYAQAMAKAVELGVAKANALAVASGVWLGKLDQINEVTSSTAYPEYRSMSVNYDAAGGKSSFGSTIVSGELTISAVVELVYQVR